MCHTFVSKIILKSAGVLDTCVEWKFVIQGGVKIPAEITVLSNASISQVRKTWYELIQ